MKEMPKILVVDDDREIVRAIAMLLCAARRAERDRRA